MNIENVKEIRYFLHNLEEINDTKQWDLGT